MKSCFVNGSYCNWLLSLIFLVAFGGLLGACGQHEKLRVNNPGKRVVTHHYQKEVRKVLVAIREMPISDNRTIENQPSHRQLKEPAATDDEKAKRAKMLDLLWRNE